MLVCAVNGVHACMCVCVCVCAIDKHICTTSVPPLVQVLYVDAAQSLTHLGGDKVVEMMEEKELRLRAPLEEVKLLKEAAEAVGDSKPATLTEGSSPPGAEGEAHIMET